MPRYEPFDWYDTPIYYDIIFDQGTVREGAFLEAVRARFGRSRGKRVLEPACGSGRLVAELARRGYAVTGCDISRSMLDFAKRRLKRRGLAGRLARAPMENFRPGTGFDLAHCLVSTFKYLRDERSARSHLRCVAESLKPGGIYVLGMHLTDYEEGSCTRERWVAARDGIDVICNIQIWPAEHRRRTERMRSRLVVRRNGGLRRYETNWKFRTYGVAQLKTLLRSVPQFEHVATFDFTHDAANPIPFDGEQLDNVLILRRRP